MFKIECTEDGRTWKLCDMTANTYGEAVSAIMSVHYKNKKLQYRIISDDE